MTLIFNSYTDFENELDHNINGVDAAFAAKHPQWATMNADNKGCWNCLNCKDCLYCEYCDYCTGCVECEECTNCIGCNECNVLLNSSDCSSCYKCSDCTDCAGCDNCFTLSGCLEYSYQGNFDVGVLSDVPIIENIHQKMLAAVTSTPDALNVKDWHSCDTTHCRAGWVVKLAGDAGSVFEYLTSPSFAAMQIYKASSTIKVFPVRFYESEEAVMADIRRCAEEEIALTAKQ